MTKCSLSAGTLKGTTIYLSARDLARRKLNSSVLRGAKDCVERRIVCMLFLESHIAVSLAVTEVVFQN